MDQELQATAWAIRSTINSTSNYSPGQMAFGRDMIFLTKVIIDWETIKAKKRNIAQYNNTRENKSRINHTYKIGDKVLIVIKTDEIKEKLIQRTEGPFEIKKVFPNGTIKIFRDTYEEIINIRRIRPYHEREN